VQIVIRRELGGPTIRQKKRLQKVKRTNTLNIHEMVNPSEWYIINIYPHIKYVKQKLTEFEVETDSSTIIVLNFNMPLLVMRKTTRQKMNTINQLKQPPINNINKIQFILIRHGTLSRIYYVRPQSNSQCSLKFGSIWLLYNNKNKICISNRRKTGKMSKYVNI
jgi:hypothetical protein